PRPPLTPPPAKRRKTRGPGPPPTAARSHEPSSRATTAASSPRGSDASRQPATPGTAPTNPVGVCPHTCRYRSSARSEGAIALADHLLRPRQCPTMNEVTRPESSCCTDESTGSGNDARNVLA